MITNLWSIVIDEGYVKLLNPDRIFFWNKHSQKMKLAITSKYINIQNKFLYTTNLSAGLLLE
jgi:hypothetical protein